MAASDARPIPRKNVAFRLTAPIFDADGDPVTGAASLDSEVSLDGAAFADCTSEATEIGSTGIYYLDLTASEMNADTVVVQIKTATSGAKTTVIVMYPEEVGDVRADVVMISGDAPAADNLEAAADGTGYNLGGGSVVSASVTGAVGSVTGNVGGNVVGSVASVTADPSGVTTLLSRLTSTRAGYLDNLSAGVVPTVAQIWAGITATAARVIADHVLRRSWASAAASADGDALSFRSLLGAVAKLVNKVGITTSTLTVYQSDDATALGTQAVTTDATADPITAVDTAG